MYCMSISLTYKLGPGRTQADSFMNLKLVESLKLIILPLKNRCVSLGADTAGETKHLNMT